MSAERKRIGIVARKNSNEATALAVTLRDRLRERGTAIRFDEATATALDDEPTVDNGIDAMDGCDLVVCIGGDGTFLFAARAIGTTPIMGINLGEVGFLNVTPPEKAIETVTDLACDLETGDLRTHELPRLSAHGTNTENTWSLPPALNEIVVQGARGPGRGIDVAVLVDGERYVEGHADGVLVSTPTGSSAYNRSEGGPLLHPALDAVVVTGMAAGRTLAPLVLDTDSEIELRVSGGIEPTVVGDGRTRQALSLPTTVRIETAEPIHVAGPPLEFFEALDKLG